MATRIVQFPAATQPDKKEKKRRKNERADGLRQVRIDLGVDPATGKRARRSFYGDTLKEAEKKREAFLREREAEERRAELMRAQGLDPALSDLTVGVWIERWQTAYGQRGGYSVQTANRLGCEKLDTALGKMRLQDVRQIHIQQLAAANVDKSKSHVTKLKQTVQQIFRSARQNQAITRDPCDGVVWQHAGAGTHRYLERWEIDHIATHWHEHRAGLWAMLMLFAGLRRGEALALRWEDIDIDTNVIHVRQGVHFEISAPIIGAPKTPAAVRDIPIFPPLRAAILAQYGPQPSVFVCVGADHKPLTQPAWERGLEGFLNAMTNMLNGEDAIQPGRRSDRDKAPRRKFSFRAHDLRHTFASMLYDAGVDVKTAQKLLGHADAVMTLKIYTHLSEAKKTDSVSKMESFSSQFTTPILHPNT